MNRPALCSLLERAPRGLFAGSGGLARSPAAAAAFFSTSPARPKLKQVSARRDRMAAAASEMGSLGHEGEAEASSTAPSAPLTRPTPAAPVADARSLGAPRPFATAEGVPLGSSLSSNKIINVRSLPRRPGGAQGGRGAAGSGSGSGSGSGNASFPGPTGVWTGFSGGPRQPGRFARGAGVRGARPGFSGGAGEAGGVAGRVRRRRRTATRGGKQGGREETEEERKARRREQQKAGRPNATEQAFLRERETDAPVAYEPTVTLASLAGYGPAVASGAASGAATVGNTSAVLRAMRLLGGGQPFDDTLARPGHAYERLLEGKPAFFDSAAERQAVEAMLLSNRLVKAMRKKAGHDGQGGKETLQPLLPVRAATKKAILSAVVRGVYAQPAPTGPNAAVFAALQRYRSKNSTWSAAAGRQFDGKVEELLASAAARKRV